MSILRSLASAALLAAALLSCAPVAFAQATAAASPPPPQSDPLDPAAPVPPLPEVRPFEGYLPYRAPAVTAWGQTNAAVTPASRSPGARQPSPGGMPASSPAPVGGAHRHHD